MSAPVATTSERDTAVRYPTPGLGQRLRAYEGWPLVAVLAGLIVLFAVWQPLFLTTQNMGNLTRQAAVLAILAIGQLFVVIGGGIDISVGAQVSLYSILVVQVTNSLGLAVGLATVLAVAIVVGLVNGLLVVKARVSPIIATLGMWQLIGGFVLWYTNGAPVISRDPAFATIGAGFIGPFAVPTLLAAAVCVLGWVLLNRTTFGRYTRAVGSNRAAATLSGIPVDRTTAGTYVLSAIAAAVAATVLASRVSSGVPDLGAGLEIAAIAAVFVGGVAWGGGVGRVSGVVVGVLLIVALSNGFDLAAVSSDVQEMITGALIVAAVSLNEFRKQRRGVT